MRAPQVVVALAVLAAVGLLASSSFAVSRSPVRSLPMLNQQVFAAINRFRTSHGLASLRESKALERAAFAHSLEMGRKSYFGHDSAGGGAFWVRVRRYYRATGYSRWEVGENLLWRTPTVSAGLAMREWIESPPHRKNLEAAQWRDLGVSAVSVPNAGGVYGGQFVTIVTTDFGVRSR